MNIDFEADFCSNIFLAQLNIAILRIFVAKILLLFREKRTLNWEQFIN